MVHLYIDALNLINFVNMMNSFVLFVGVMVMLGSIGAAVLTLWDHYWTQKEEASQPFFQIPEYMETWPTHQELEEATALFVWNEIVAEMNALAALDEPVFDRFDPVAEAEALARHQEDIELDELWDRIDNSRWANNNTGLHAYMRAQA